MGWIEDYVHYNASQESPPEFHKWVGLATIASVLNRRVSLPRVSEEGVTFYTLFPGQLVICLVAGAGLCRKSTAVTIGKAFMKEGGVNLFDGKITPERLLSKLGSMPGGRPVITIVASELSTFLTKATYNEGLTDILLKLFDSESNPYETQKGTTVDLAAPCVTCLWATTPFSLGESIPASAHSTGFLSRILSIYSDQPGKPASLANNASDIDPAVRRNYDSLRSSLIVRLRGMANLSGEFSWEPSGRDWFTNYYLSYRDSGVADDEGYPQRRPDHLLRISMCLSASEHGASAKLSLCRSLLETADSWLTEIEAKMPKAYAYIGNHTNSAKYSKILQVFKDKGREVGVRYAVISSEELYNRAIRHFSSVNELQQHLQGLVDAGNIGIIGRDPVTQKLRYTVLKELY
jgi:hypothetical protein